MGKQRIVLKHQPRAALLRSGDDAPTSIKPDSLAASDEAILGMHQPGNRTQQRSLAASRRPDESQQLSRPTREFCIERHRQVLADGHLQMAVPVALRDICGTLTLSH